MPIPVITVAQMREWENATWASGQTEEAVMRLAGHTVARQAAQLTRAGDFVLVLAGKGHNGDDARFAAESELLSGRKVQLLRALDPEAALTDLSLPLHQSPALIIDGLFGIGLNRPLSADWIKLIREINTSGRPILAVDVPSGLNAETGEPLEDAIHATRTITFGAAKRGLLKPSAIAFVGRLEVAADIGLVPCPFETEIKLLVAEDFSSFPPRRPFGGHKGTFGHLGIIAGSVGYHGASVLAARGAQRAQPGLITLCTAPNVYHPVAAQLQSVMVRPWDEQLRFPESITALAVGPGLASSDVPEFIRDKTRQFWKESPRAIIVDASALEWLPAGSTPDAALRVMTPHPGEAARLLKTSTEEVQNDRLQAVRRLSKRFGHCLVVLKGHQTIIGRDEDCCFVNSSGNSFLAQGGSGDLLTGFLGGLLAQPLLQADATKTTGYGVWEHGAAADLLSTTRPNWTVEDLAEVLGGVRAS